MLFESSFVPSIARQRLVTCEGLSAKSSEEYSVVTVSEKPVSAAIAEFRSAGQPGAAVPTWHALDRHQRNARSYQQCRQPASAAYAFVQKNTRGDCVGDKGERG